MNVCEQHEVTGVCLFAHDGSDVPHAWARREPVFIATEALCPPLARLIDARWVIGLRNPGHTVAKLIDPTRGGAALRVVNHTHPEYGQALATFLRHTHANAILMRGTEGERVARRTGRRHAGIEPDRRAKHRQLRNDAVAGRTFRSQAENGIQIGEIEIVEPKLCA